MENVLFFKPPGAGMIENVLFFISQLQTTRGNTIKTDRCAPAPCGITSRNYWLDYYQVPLDDLLWRWRRRSGASSELACHSRLQVS